MFNLIRRISYGVIPRPDRPWEDDPTSNAPNTRRKRRLSSTERGIADDEEQANKKKARGDSATPSVANAEGSSSEETKPQVDTQEVKEVTEGVKEVTLESKDDKETQDDATAPETVPLPEDKSGELDDLSSEAAPSVPTAAEPSSEEAPANESSTIPADDASDVASSSGDVGSPTAAEELSNTTELLSTIKTTPTQPSEVEVIEA